MTNLINQTRELVVARQVEKAWSLGARLQGLLGRSSLEAEAALWIHPCNSIHTFFMKFAIDVIFVDGDLVVRKVVRHIPPWRLVLPVWKACSVFEMAAGQATPERVNEGDRLHVGH